MEMMDDHNHSSQSKSHWSDKSYHTAANTWPGDSTVVKHLDINSKGADELFVFGINKRSNTDTERVPR